MSTFLLPNTLQCRPRRQPRGGKDRPIGAQRERIDHNHGEPRVRPLERGVDGPVLTGAVVDRIAHQADAVDMTGESYRVIKAKEWIEKTNKMMV